MKAKEILGLSLYTFFLLFIFTIISLFVIGYLINSFTIVNGSNELTAQEKNISEFDSVKNASSFEIILKKSETEKVTVIAETNIINEVQVYKKNKELIIELQKYFPYINPITINNNQPIKVLVEYKELRSISQIGSGSISLYTGEILESLSLDVLVRGSGNINFAVKTEDLTAKVEGSGWMKLTGSSIRNELELTGSGEINATNLESNESKTDLTGSGRIVLKVKDSLNVNITGSGEVIYLGEPKTFLENIKGSGKVQKKS